MWSHGKPVPGYRLVYIKYNTRHRKFIDPLLHCVAVPGVYHSQPSLPAITAHFLLMSFLVISGAFNPCHFHIDALHHTADPSDLQL